MFARVEQLSPPDAIVTQFGLNRFFLFAIQIADCPDEHLNIVRDFAETAGQLCSAV